jgi:deazaflavin-dependent oxidoreductase (nitroreductase family)
MARSPLHKFKLCKHKALKTKISLIIAVFYKPMSTNSAKPNLPHWLKWANPIVVFLNRSGLPVGTMEVLTTTGRHSGKAISHPVSLLTVGGERYLCTVGDVNWVLNARANPQVTLQRGRHKYTATLTEIPESGRGAILREFPAKVPGGIGFFRTSLGIAGTPEAFEQAADRCRVFQILSA